MRPESAIEHDPALSVAFGNHLAFLDLRSSGEIVEA